MGTVNNGIEMNENIDIAEEATEIANHIQAYLAGRSSAACLYGMGMVLASFASLGHTRDVDGLMGTVKNIVNAELKRQLSN